MPILELENEISGWSKIISDVQLNSKLSQIQQLKELLYEYSNLFSNIPGCTDLAEHDIELESERAIVAMPYRMSPRQIEILKSEVNKMLELKIIPYLDDIAIFSLAWDDHLKDLFYRLRSAKLHIKPSKCQFSQAYIKYLGHLVGQGLRTSGKLKVQVIKDFPIPTNKTQVRTFLGLVGYYRRYIPEISVIAAPLTDLLKGRNRKSTVDWNSSCQNAFEELKTRLSENPVLYSPDFTKPFIIQCDASNLGIGVVLSQVCENEEQSIMFLSKKLSLAEQKYSTTEKECAAIIFAVQKLKCYLDGHQKKVILFRKPFYRGRGLLKAAPFGAKPLLIGGIGGNDCDERKIQKRGKYAHQEEKTSAAWYGHSNYSRVKGHPSQPPRQVRYFVNTKYFNTRHLFLNGIIQLNTNIHIKRKYQMELLEERVYPTPFSLSPLFPMLMLSLATERQSPITRTSFQSEYDYIIVGAGAAGSVVASRLSEIPCVSVLLLEAGQKPPKVTEIPAAAGSFIMSDLDWKYRTVPQRHTGSALIDRRVILPCGRTLGGGSTVNALVMSRGNRKNYDEWAKLGAQGWGILFNTKIGKTIVILWHGIGGPITVERQNYQPEVKAAIVDSASELGYKFVDVNGPTQHGFYDFQATLRKGKRCSTAKGYLVPSENRTNLHILSRAMVTKVLFEKKQAVGVEFDFRGKRHHVAARREVIVSAGAINTAKLLMISGIGPMNELERLRIPVVADLPVGRNLQEHPAGFVAFELDESVELLHKRLFDEENISKYIKDRSGPLAYSSGISLIAFLSNNSTGEAKDITDHELYFLELPALAAKLRVGFTPKAYQQVFGPYEKKPILVCLSQILHPKSRGFVRLRTNSPYDFPDIDPNYLDDPQDLKDVVEGLKTCVKILQAPPMSKVGARMFNTSFPGCEGFMDDLEVFLKCLTRAAVMSLSHPVGTAKMGDPRDPSTVVDPELRVKTVERLRVIDSSVMPTIVWGNTNVPTIMIAEKASDMIKRTIHCRSLGRG
ncbi:glucose dehydrogenase [Trichonephila inaurata madagascariensis]|uniref:RNA-directed DNA polymerase n=1 Tax=Trichonephila inaurata madagascariensis TaxID=2747483 RepID=A0A8X6WMT1_9ARAC|nr:glucose dehydrogenase [Trichonephila inaurata madagascariensis]